LQDYKDVVNDDTITTEVSEIHAAPKREFKVKWGFIILYVVTCAINGICVAWTTGGSNQTSSIFAAKLDWTESETRFYNTLLNFAS